MDKPKIGQLVWGLYKVNPPKYYLIFWLGEHEDHLVGLIADRLTDMEIKILKANIANLRTINLPDMVKELQKLKCFNALTNAYRRFNIKNFDIRDIKDIPVTG